MVCRKTVTDGLSRLDAASKEVAFLEAQLAGAALTPDQVELLARRRAELEEVEAGLTLNNKADSVIEPALTATGRAGAMTSLIKPADFEQWFEVVREMRTLDPRKVKSRTDLDSDASFTIRSRLIALPSMIRMPDGSEAPGPMAGIHGYEVTSTLDAKSLGWFSCGPGTEVPTCTSRDVGEASITGSRGLVYRRSVGSTISVRPLDQPCAAAGSCMAAFPNGTGKPRWLGQDQASKSGSVKFQQLSRLFVLPTGGSIFGSRMVGATFDASGAPTMLQFDKGGGGKDAASILDASVAAAQSASGARLAATKTRIDELESAQKLHDLLQSDLD